MKTRLRSGSRRRAVERESFTGRESSLNQKTHSHRRFSSQFSGEKRGKEYGFTQSFWKEIRQGFWEEIDPEKLLRRNGRDLVENHL
ncbi:hypothetical protein L484_010065 [Morus notabilis]|uniref:Uncharacterized protein n=1 Tax=Morus notabilis TaxID=981085 RepID=W9S3J6_9ROSA|nr:hypothetical protein L484_010065 [Morus notabilis]